VHAAFGLRPWHAAPLPLEERDLPATFTHLDEEVQADRTEAVLRAVFTWAAGQGADEVEVALLKPDDDELARLGLQPVGPRTLTGAFTVERLLPLLRRRGVERVWITRHGDLLVYMHETWDSVVVTAAEHEVGDLRSRLADVG